ncbi:hypothetical protein AB0H12_21725 [Actinosynnema sp. NPDC023794]
MRFTLVGEADDVCTAGLLDPTCSDHGEAERLAVIDQVLPAGTAVAALRVKANTLLNGPVHVCPSVTLAVEGAAVAAVAGTMVSAATAPSETVTCSTCRIRVIMFSPLCGGAKRSGAPLNDL